MSSDKMLAKFMSYSNHNDIKDVSLRTWNRCQTAVNIKEDLGSAFAEKYLAKLDKNARTQVNIMFGFMSTLGQDEVRRQVMRG